MRWKSSCGSAKGLSQKWYGYDIVWPRKRLVDGDKALVVADPHFVQIAERNMKDVVPLYYNMRKAEPCELNKDNIFKGLPAAFTGGNIGPYSNNISKILNSDVFINGSYEERQGAMNTIKLLCMENNFCID